MVIHSPGRELFVVRSVRRTAEVEQLLCRDERRKDGRLYTLMVYKQPQKIYDAIALFMQMKKKATTPDFVDCFSRDGNFHVLFLYHEGKSLLGQHERKELMRRERMEACNGLLSQILMQDLPCGVLSECLEGENLRFDTSLQVSFGYGLNKAEGYRFVEMPHVMEQAADILTTLLGEDARREDEFGHSAKEIIASMKGGKYPRWQDVYAAFKPWYDHVRTQVETQAVEKPTWITKFWKIVSRIVGIVKPLLAIALVAASIFYLVYSLMNPPVADGATPGQIQMVGDVPVPTLSPMPTQIP